MLINEPSLRRLESIHRLMGLPEPVVYCELEDGAICAMVTGWMHPDTSLAVLEHWIVLPSAKRKFRTMMTMSRELVNRCHERGYDVVLSIAKTDTRSGLRAWAARCKFLPYDSVDPTHDWYINRKEDTSLGQEVTAEAETAPDGPAEP